MEFDRGDSAPRTRISIPEDPGQAGKDQAAGFVRLLAGRTVVKRRPSSDKITRAEPFAAQWQAGNVDLVRGAWNEPFLAELEAFPDAKHDDQVDAASDAFAVLVSGAGSGYAVARRDSAAPHPSAARSAPPIAVPGDGPTPAQRAAAAAAAARP